MNKFLRHPFRRCLAPKLDGNGQVIRNRDGGTSYVKTPQNVCVSIAKRLCGNENPYLNPWFYHIDEKHPEDDILICLDPNEPGKNNRELGRVVDNDNRRIADALEAETQCPIFGTVKCVQKCTFCDSCKHVGTKKCRRCKKKCEECQLDNTVRVINRDNLFIVTDDNEAVSIPFDTPSTVNIEGAYMDKATRYALFDGLDALDDVQRSVIHYTFVDNMSEREIAERLGFKSKTQVVRIREKALAILREKLKDFRD